MKRRNSKKTGVIALIAGLSSVTLVSVGFASWIISAGDTAEVTGSISVDEVDDSRYLIEKTVPNAPAVSYGENESPATSIVFGAPANSTTGWLTNNSSAKVNLTATVTFYVANLTGKTKGTDYNISGSIEATGEHKAAFEKAVSDKLVELPVITKNTSFTVHDDTTHDTKIGGTTYTFTMVTLELNFKWGTYFGKDAQDNTTNTNPYVFYNAKEIDGYVNGVSGDTWGDDAKSKLDEIHLANGANFKVTLTTEAK